MNKQTKADWEDFQLANGMKENQSMSPIEQELNQLLQHSRMAYDDLATKFAALKAQRDELVAALREIADSYLTPPAVQSRAKAALARAEGRPQ